MKKLGKRIAAVSAAMVVAVSMMSIGAGAVTDVESGKLSDYTVKGSSTVTATTGSSSTITSANTTATVTGTYSYVNTSTGKTSRSNGYMYSASVSFDAPSGCRSVKETGSHSVSYSSQKWTASTSATY